MHVYLLGARQRAVAAERGAAGDAEPGLLRVVPLPPGARRRLRRPAAARGETPSQTLAIIYYNNYLVDYVI